MNKLIEITNPDFDEHLYIQYMPTNVCNYKCNYCWPDSHAGTSRWPDINIISKNFDHLLTIYKTQFNKKSIRLHLLGGEATLWPEMGDFAKFLYDKHRCRITISTNGSRTVRWWKEYAKYFNDIQISVHHEFCDLDHIKSVMDTIYNDGTIMVSANVYMDPLAWSKCETLVNELYAHPTPWMLKVKPLVVASGEDWNSIRPEYTQEHLDYIKQNDIKRFPPDSYVAKMRELDNIDKSTTNAKLIFSNGDIKPYNMMELMESKQNSFRNWECQLAPNRIHIQHDGKMQGSCGEDRIFGDTIFSINDPNFVNQFTSDVIKPVICSRIFCGCPAEIKLPKRKVNV